MGELPDELPNYSKPFSLARACTYCAGTFVILRGTRMFVTKVAAIIMASENVIKH